MRKSFWIELFERRVPYGVGVYIGAVWVLVEITQRLVDRYFLSPFLTDIVFWGLFSFLPAVVLMVWTHGRPGADKATKTELVGVPVNLILTIGILFTLYGNKDLGAAVERVSVIDERGQTTERVVAKDAYHHRILLYFWDNLPDPNKPDETHRFSDTSEWERFAIQQLLRDQLEQSPFLTVAGPLRGSDNAFRAKLRRAGYELGVDVPLQVKAEIARDHNYTYFLTGGLRLERNGYKLQAHLYNAQTLEQLTTVDVPQQPLPDAAEYIAYRLKDYLEVPGNHQLNGQFGDNNLETPVSEFCTSVQVALRDLTRGQVAWLLRNNSSLGRRLITSALDKDPRYFSAILEIMQLEYRDGNVTAAREWIHHAQQLVVRLPERQQARLRLLIYRLQDDAERELRLLQAQVELNPNDIYWLQELGRYYADNQQAELARESYQRLLEVDPKAVEVIKSLASLEIGAQDFDAADKWVDRLLETTPNDYLAYLLRGDIRLASGDTVAARDSYLNAQVLDGTTIEPLLKLADLANRNGDFNSAADYFAEAQALVTTDQQLDKLLASKSISAERRGQIGLAIDLTLERRELDVFDTLDSVFTIESRLVNLYGYIGEFDQAQAVLDNAYEQLESPLSDFLEISEAQLRVLRAEFQLGQTTLQHATTMVRQHGAIHLEQRLAAIRGDLARSQGRWQDAFDAYQQVSNSSGDADVQLQQHALAGQAVAAHHLGYQQQANALLHRQLSRDAYHPEIWLARAQLQYAQGQQALAEASLQTVLAVYSNADKNYHHYRQAVELLENIRRSG